MSKRDCTFHYQFPVAAFELHRGSCYSSPESHTAREENDSLSMHGRKKSGFRTLKSRMSGKRVGRYIKRIEQLGLPRPAAADDLSSWGACVSAAKLRDSAPFGHPDSFRAFPVPHPSAFSYVALELGASFESPSRPQHHKKFYLAKPTKV